MPDNVALLAFTYDRDDELEGVYDELKALDAVFQRSADLCLPNTRWKARQDDIEDAFRKLGDKVRIFHFSGHAGPSVLQLNQDEFTPKVTFAGGLAAYISGAGKGLRLVFLNGCATADQAKLFIDRGVPAVIATTRPIQDRLAYNFATRFYKEFTDPAAGRSLQDAFGQALHSFEAAHGPVMDMATGRIRPELIDERVRSHFADDDDYGMAAALYELHLHPAHPGIAQETFAQWMKPARPTVRANTTTAGKHEMGYLLCNRRKEEDAFRQVCLQKMQGQLPEPIFFLVHETTPHAPQLLPERFRLFLLPSWSNRDFQYETLPLPLPEDFGSGAVEEAANPERDKFKIRLSELYQERFGGEPAVNQHLCRLQLRPPAERLLVVHHEWQPGKWIDRNGNQTDEWQRRAQALLRWYIGVYAADLRQSFSERLVVIITARYLRPDAYFPALCAGLGTDFPGQVYDLPQLSPILLEDVDDWQDDFLGDASRTFLDPAALFDKIQPQADALPLMSVKDALVAEIKRYNELYHGAD
jgi:hypothetical protein